MKKLLFLALAALSVSVAQAVTVSYSGTSSGTTISLTDVDYSKPVTLVYTFKSLDSLSSDQGEWLHVTLGGTIRIFNVGTYDGKNISPGVYNGSFMIAGDMMTDTDYTIYFVVDGTTPACAGSFYITNSTGTWDTTSDPWSLIGSSSTVSATTDNTLTGTLTLDEGLMSETTLTITYTSTDEVVLPEPTVLALLALGVAGLALKRRVA